MYVYNFWNIFLKALTFEANMILISCQLSDTVIHIEEKKLRYCEDEGTLPDLALVHGRLLVQAWEQGTYVL